MSENDLVVTFKKNDGKGNPQTVVYGNAKGVKTNDNALLRIIDKEGQVIGMVNSESIREVRRQAFAPFTVNKP